MRRASKPLQIVIYVGQRARARLIKSEPTLPLVRYQQILCQGRALPESRISLTIAAIHPISAVSALTAVPALQMPQTRAACSPTRRRDAQMLSCPWLQVLPCRISSAAPRLQAKQAPLAPPLPAQGPARLPLTLPTAEETLACRVGQSLV